MRVLLLSHSTVAHLVGGVETHVELVARAAAELGHEVEIVTTAHPRGIPEERRDGFRITYLHQTPPARYSKRWFTLSAAFVNGQQADLLLSFSLAGYGLIRHKPPWPHWVFASGKTLSHTVSEWYNRRGLKGLLAYPKRALGLCYYAWLERRLWARLDGVIATYDALFQDLRQQGLPVFLCYNGTDPQRFRPDPVLRHTTRRLLGIGPEDPVLLMVATVNRQKGIWVGVEAFQRLAPAWPELSLIIVGDGPDRLRLERAVEETPLASRIRFVGAVPLFETARYFAAADLFLYPTFRMEGLPNAIVQAMAAGLPVLASDRGGIRSAVRPGETGLLLSRPAVGPLVEAVAGLLADPPLRALMGQKARALALSVFDIRIQVAKLLEELSQLS